MKKQDILEKGAIVQRDGERFAIAPHIPGGFLEVAVFKKMVDVAQKYEAAAMKMTSGQRIAIVGLREEDLDAVWDELKMSIGHAIGLCVRMVKFCPGTTYCRHGKQDAMGVGMTLDQRYHGRLLSAKFKIGVAGCEYACNAPVFKEVGLRGMPGGWTVTAGGTCGARPRMGDVLAENLSDADAVAMADRVVTFFEGCPSKEKVRLGRVIDDMGTEAFKKAVGA